MGGIRGRCGKTFVYAVGGTSSWGHWTETDASAFHADGLDREETAFVLDDFHRVKNPRLMTEGYFESVLEVYDDLAECGPMD